MFLCCFLDKICDILTLHADRKGFVSDLTHERAAVLTLSPVTDALFRKAGMTRGTMTTKTTRIEKTMKDSRTPVQSDNMATD